MPLTSSNSESTTSAIKTRFRYKIQPQQEPIEPQNALVKSSSSPNLLLKSALRDSNILVQSSCYKERSLNLDEDEETSSTTARSFEFRLDPSFWKEHNIQVIIRVRPLSNAEISLQGHSRCVKQDNSQSITWIGHPESRFTFDLVADETVSQENLFKVAGVPMVENCMEGYNSCMFAYGQTGSGKTHTMLGDIEGGTRRHSVNCGMTPRVFEYLFSRIQKEKDVRREEKLNFTCRCSFLEIYNEQILDLLEPSSVNLQIREDIKKGVYVENLKEVEVTSARDVIQQLIQGSANRKVAATNMNRASSRSHSVFTCIIESKWESQGVTHRRFAHLNLVDLAGSERQKSSGAEGERLKEATNINKSLSTLGLVIMNLVSISSGKSLHVPYRDSKLTFLLQDSLGGNAKTTIIANISPANCCSLETLSTLKFAQRAKFIKNHAIVNEDTSGDVLALKIENQNLKKEVSRLRSLVNGGAANGDALPLTFPVSPGSSFKWDTSRGFSSPLISEKKTSHLQKEHEMALVGALRRKKDKDAALQVLAAEKQAALQLAKQREEEVQGLKMRLRFREAAVKRLEAVASGKIQADMHLLKEKEEHLKEIEALRAQIERNPEVTRFAMENLQLKEEIARLKAFCEEGQRENMTEQIMILESKLLEALDWKLMHESDTADLQESVSTLSTSMNEENEFLRIQAIQKQSELESLRKKLDFCLEEKANIERYASDLAKELEAELLSKRTLIGNNDQTEIKTMVDAIAAATQKETEAHETAMRLSYENEELRMKLKVLIEDNNKLIDLYERTVADNKKNSGNDALISEEELVRDQNCCHSSDEVAEDTQLEMKGEIDSLKRQLAEMHEENDKLLTLYEKAMQERDEFKRVIASDDSRSVKGSSFQEKIDGGLHLTFEEAPLVSIDEDERKHKGIIEQLVRNDDTDLDDMQVNPLTIIGSSLEEAHLYEIYVHEEGCNESAISFEANLAENGISEETVVDKMETDQLGEFEEQEHIVHLLKDLDSVQRKLFEAQEKLSDSSEMVSQFGSIEESIIEVGTVSEKICEVERDIHSKQQEYEALKSLSSDLEERKDVANKKLMALKHSLMSFSSSVSYFEQREDSARSELEDSLQHVTHRKEQISRLQAIKQELKGELSKLKQIDNDLRISLENMKMRLGEENKKIESERVLLPIDNADKRADDIPQRSWQTTGKALELLKSEEEKMKLQNQIKLQRERIGDVRKEAEAVKKVKLSKVYSDLQILETEMQKEVASVGALDRKLQSIVGEKQMLLEVRDNARREFESMIVEYYQSLFESELKVEEVKIMNEELVVESQKLEGLQRVKDEAVMKKNQLLENMSGGLNTVSDVVKCGLLSARNSIAELSFMLQNFS